MALVKHSLATATCSNWVYTMDLAGFEEYIQQLAARPLDAAQDEDQEQLIRIARMTIRDGMTATQRQWERLQTAFANQPLQLSYEYEMAREERQRIAIVEAKAKAADVRANPRNYDLVEAINLLGVDEAIQLHLRGALKPTEGEVYVA